MVACIDPICMDPSPYLAPDRPTSNALSWPFWGSHLLEAQARLLTPKLQSLRCFVNTELHMHCYAIAESYSLLFAPLLTSTTNLPNWLPFFISSNRLSMAARSSP